MLSIIPLFAFLSNYYYFFAYVYTLVTNNYYTANDRYAGKHEWKVTQSWTLRALAYMYTNNLFIYLFIYLLSFI